MTETSGDPLAPFDDEILETVAAEYGVDVGRLRRVVRRHQELVARLPGVEDVVYEWRKQFPSDPVVERRPDAYYLSVAASVWPEYVAALELEESDAQALQAVHGRQLAATVGDEPTGDRGPMVLARR